MYMEVILKFTAILRVLVLPTVAMLTQKQLQLNIFKMESAA
jgi:hypothetical protein